jgi:HTH-type transcriptional regulator/antitoxin HipB
MKISTPADLGSAIRARRKALGLDQGELAGRIGVRRQWVSKIEAGKATAEIGLVLRALAALGFSVELGEPAAPARPIGPPKGVSFDLDAVIARARGRVEAPRKAPATGRFDERYVHAKARKSR